ncbi:MAG: DUF4149 domain-containing protein [Beijerinckiaceae bacterium]|nr:DUF4149 domain-containing protein [Beijerinckiaceae bacterium]
MINLIDATGFALAAFVFGSMVFFSVIMAPLIFIKLEAAIAGRFIRQVFPWYYLAVIVSSAVAALLLSFGHLRQAAMMSAIALIGFVARQILMPLINHFGDQAKRGLPKAKARFERLHRTSVVLNFLQIVVALLAVIEISLPR